jgi:hypothetical protein
MGWASPLDRSLLPSCFPTRSLGICRVLVCVAQNQTQTDDGFGVVVPWNWLHRKVAPFGLAREGRFREPTKPPPKVSTGQASGLLVF